MKTLEIIVSGKVQGVFYRASAKAAAERLGIRGRVKNLRDGRVWMIATGSEEQIESFVKWNQEGPAQARVDHLEKKPSEDPGYSDFRIERDN